MFFSKRLTKQLLAVFMAVSLPACSDASKEDDTKQATSQPSQLQVLDVYKRPSCGCCSKWISHLNDKGFETKTHNSNNLSALKIEKSIQPRYHSCHTAISKDGYVFEGHIPAKFIQQFLQEKPEGAIGLAVPAMPLGSPGMEAGNRFTPYQVLLLKSDGSAETYARVETREEQY